MTGFVQSMTAMSRLVAAASQRRKEETEAFNSMIRKPDTTYTIDSVEYGVWRVEGGLFILRKYKNGYHPEEIREITKTEFAAMLVAYRKNPVCIDCKPQMYAYPHTKCSWGYILLCHECACGDAVDKYTDLANPIKEPPAILSKLQRCEICGYQFRLGSPS